jgi:hypothetical protein
MGEMLLPEGEAPEVALYASRVADIVPHFHALLRDDRGVIKEERKLEELNILYTQNSPGLGGDGEISAFSERMSLS